MLRIPMALPDLNDADIAAVNQVLQTPTLSIGPRIAGFEALAAAYAGSRFGVGVCSGTAGLHMCVIAAGVADGDCVVTTPFSFVASANVMLYERAVPIFVDIDPQTLNIDPALVGEAVEALRRGKGYRGQASGVAGSLKAVLPVHAFGQPADMDPIVDLAKDHGLAVIEDACEAIGAEYKGRRVGAIGDAGVFAFYPNKQMTTGEGGLIVTNREDWDGLLRSLRNQGRDVFDAWLNHSRLGYNYRLDEMSAALGASQLKRIDDLLANRERVAGWYNERLRSFPELQIPFIAPTTTRMSWFIYVVRLAPGFERTTVMNALEERGIPSRPYFSPIHLQPFYRKRFGYKEGDFPVTEAVARTTLALPFYGTMAEEQVDFVCENLLAILQSRKACAR